MTETAAKATFLTQEAYDRLKAELAELTGPARTEIAKKIDAARQEGDLRENGGYHAAREEQGKMEARIRQLQQLLTTAIIGEKSPIGAAVNGHSVGETVTYATPSGKDVQVKILKTKPYSG